MVKINLFPIILGILGISALFLYTQTPFQQSKMSALWNVLLVGAIGATVLFYFQKQKSIFYDFFELSSIRSFFDRFAVGVIWGVLGLFLLSILTQGIVALVSVFGSIPKSVLASVTNEGAFFTVVVQPLSESFLIIAALLFVYAFLKKVRLPLAMTFSIIVVSLFFAAFHFATLGAQYYEYSPTGFVNFLGDLSGYGTESYHGGFPLVLMGLFWLVLAVLYNDFVVPFAAHLVNNWYVLFVTPNLGPAVTQFVNLVLIIMIVVVGIVLWKDRLGFLDNFNFKYLTRG